MGLDEGWVIGPKFGLAHAQQLTALVNGVVSRQAAAALVMLQGRG